MLIAQLSDLHIIPPGTRAYGVVETNPMVERAFQAVAGMDPAPDAVILSGDLTDGGSDGEYDILAEMIRRHLRMPVYVIPGNHDRREGMKARLGHLPGVTRDPKFVHYVI
jgi:Icc protein